MARNEKSRRKNNAQRPNMWGFFQNVLIAALNKGQLLPMFFGLIILVLILKIPGNEVVPFLKDCLNISKFNSILGWILGVITTFGGFFVLKWQRRIHTKEIQRISAEKRGLQRRLMGDSLPTSNN